MNSLKSHLQGARKIASLDVYINQESEDSAFTTGDRGKFVICINRGPAEMAIDTPAQFQDVLAHELGHFVALLSKDPTQSSEVKFLANLTGDQSFVISAEKKAWELGKKIRPAIDGEQEKLAMATYYRESSLPLPDEYRLVASKPNLCPPPYLCKWEDDGGMVLPEPEPDTTGEGDGEFDAWFLIPPTATEKAETAWLKQHGKLQPRHKERIKKTVRHPVSRGALFGLTLFIGVCLMEVLDHSRSSKLLGLPIAGALYHGVLVLVDVICDRLF